MARQDSNITQLARLFKYEKILGIDIVNKPYKNGVPFLKGMTIFPKRNNNTQVYVDMSKCSARSLYGTKYSDKPCALWLEPYEV